MNSIKVSYSQFSPISLLEKLKYHYDLPTDSITLPRRMALNTRISWKKQFNSY